MANYFLISSIYLLSLFVVFSENLCLYVLSCQLLSPKSMISPFQSRSNPRKIFVEAFQLLEDETCGTTNPM